MEAIKEGGKKRRKTIGKRLTLDVSIFISYDSLLSI